MQASLLLPATAWPVKAFDEAQQDFMAPGCAHASIAPYTQGAQGALLNLQMDTNQWCFAKPQ